MTPPHDIVSTVEVTVDGLEPSCTISCRCGSEFTAETEEEARRQHLNHHSAATGLPEIAALRDQLKGKK